MGNLFTNTPEYADAVLTYNINEPWYSDIVSGKKSVHIVPGKYNEYVDKIGAPIAFTHANHLNNPLYEIVKIKTVRSFASVRDCLQSTDFDWTCVVPQAASIYEAEDILNAVFKTASGSYVALILEHYY